MSAQRLGIGPVELDTTTAAESPAPPESLAASIPPELFRDILAYVGDKARLGYDEYYLLSSSLDPDARREEMKHLSACASTCVYWAQLTRERMFGRLTLRSSKDLSGLLSLLRAPQSPRIPPICDILQHLHVYYTLGDHPWFHNLTGLVVHHQISQQFLPILHITGPATPAFVAASTRGSILHPLFFAVPRVLSVMFSKSCNFFIDIENIHLPNPTVLFNLIQDCLSLRPCRTNCTNLTWDLDPVLLQATPSSIGLKYACRTADIGFTNEVSGCTDDILVAAMLKSVPHHEFFQRRQGPHLDPLETSFLFDVMRTTWSGSSPELERTETFQIRAYSDPASIQDHAAIRLPAGTDFCLEWKGCTFIFTCIASRLPHAPANNIRNITRIIIDLWLFKNHHELRRYMQTANIDWDTVLHTVRQFPHLRQVVIRHSDNMGYSARQILVEFFARMGVAWFGLGELPGLYYKGWKESEWVQLRLDTLMDEIEQRREEIKAEADAEEDTSSELESSSRRRRGGIE